MARRCEQVGMWATVALWCWLLTLGALAQTPAEIALAREQFSVGVEAARGAHWPEALAAFERSHALYAHPETLFNIAGARQKMGRLVAASEAYRSYLRSPSSAVDAQRRAQAEARLSEIAGQIGRAGIRIEGIQDGDLVSLDGQALSRAALDSDLPVDPGEHALQLVHGTEVVAETRVAVHARQRVEVRLVRAETPAARAVVAVPSARAAADASLAQQASLPAARNDAPVRERLVRKWWLWTAVGAVVAGGVTATLLLTADDAASDEVKGNFGTGVTEIR